MDKILDNELETLGRLKRVERDSRRLHIGMLPQIMDNHMEKNMKSEREPGLLQGLILIMQCRSRTTCKY